MTKVKRTKSPEFNRLTKTPRWIRICLTNPDWKKMELKDWNDYVETIHNTIYIEANFTARSYSLPFSWDADNMFKRDRISFTIYPSAIVDPSRSFEFFLNELDKAYKLRKRYFNSFGYTYAKYIREIAEEQKIFISQKFRDYVQRETDYTNYLFDAGMAGEKWVEEHGKYKKPRNRK